MFSVRKHYLTWKKNLWLILLSLIFLLRSALVPFDTVSAASNEAVTQSDNTSSQSAVEGAATLGVARLVGTKLKNIKDGSVVSSSKDGAILTNTAYDSQVLGVVSQDAAILLNTTNTGNEIPVISTGTLYILVSTKDGPIHKGDWLTTSTIPGVAVKAMKDGYVLGTALEDDTNPPSKQPDTIAIDLNLHYINTRPTFPGSLTDLLKIAVLPTKDSPAPIFKYIVAAGVVLASFVFAFLTFGRTAAKGIEALGRNPAASGTIHLGIIFNVAIIVVIVLSGLMVSFLILRI